MNAPTNLKEALKRFQDLVVALWVQGYPANLCTQLRPNSLLTGGRAIYQQEPTTKESPQPCNKGVVPALPTPAQPLACSAQRDPAQPSAAQPSPTRRSPTQPGAMLEAWSYVGLELCIALVPSSLRA